MKPTVLLLGGTGAMGDYLRPLLADKGFQVVVTSRSDRKPEPGVQFVKGNGHDGDFVNDLMDKIHPDAVVDFMIYRTREFAARRDDLLRRTGHYLFLSSYRVFAGTTPIVESSPRLLDTLDDPDYLATDEYALAKASGEDLLRQAPTRNWTIIRPSITYSKSRFQLGCLEAYTFLWRHLRGLPSAMPAEMMAKQTTMTWGGDVARMISKLVLNPVAFAEDFNVVTAEHRSWRDISDIYREAIGLEVLPMPLEDYANLTGRAKTFYDRMFDRVMDNSKVLKATGLRQADFAPLAPTLSNEVRAFLQHPTRLTPNILHNIALDKVCKTRIPLADFDRYDRFRYWRANHPWAGRIFTDRLLANTRKMVHLFKHKGGGT